MKKLLLVLVAAATLVPLATPSAAVSDPSGPPPAPKLSIADGSAVENEGFVEFEVSLDAPSDRLVLFRVFGFSGTALVRGTTTNPNNDTWRVTNRVFAIHPGDTTKTVRVYLRDDDRPEPNEYFTVTARPVLNAVRGDNAATGVIYDDDLRLGRQVLDVNLLHINDHHSHLQAEDIELEIDGAEVEFELGGFGRVGAAFESLEQSLAGENVVKIHAGDAITGTLFYSLFKGAADAAVMNEVCFDIFTLGNHEFDDSDAGLRTFLEALADGDCDTDVLAANVIPAFGTPLAPLTPTDFFEPFTIRDFDGERVGFIGIDIAQKTKVSSSPLDTTEFLDEVETAQFYTDVLTAMGIDNIVLVTHQGYQRDLDLASQVAGVDAIIGGDSHSLLGDFSRYGLTPQGPYPTWATDRAGNPVCVAQAWQYSYVVGALQIGFDTRGHLTDCGGTPYLLLGDVLDDGGVAPDAIDAALADDPQLLTIEPDAGIEAVLDDFEDQVDVLNETVIGTATEPICLARFPSDGRSTICTPDELTQGGEIQQLVTEAFLARAFRADIALQNSGGVRIDIDAGDVTIGEAYTLLPFANTLFEIELTGAEIVLALEQGISNVVDAGGSTGAYPYGAGIRWDLDVTQAFGSRFSNIEVRPKGTTDWVPIDLGATYVAVANSFMAGGGDGYFALEDAVDDGRGVDTFLDYAQSFIDYIQIDAGGVISAPTEFSTKSFIG